MTEQIKDVFFYKGKALELTIGVGIDNRTLAEDIVPEYFNIDYKYSQHHNISSCWRGYVAGFTIRKKKFILDKYSTFRASYSDKINKIKPVSNSDKQGFTNYGTHIFNDLNIPSKGLSGKFLLTDTFADFSTRSKHNTYIMGVLGYKTLIEVVVENDTVTSVTDLSKLNKEIRDTCVVPKDGMVQLPETLPEGYPKWVLEKYGLIPKKEMATFRVGRPEYVGKMPQRIDLCVEPADDPQEIGFSCTTVKFSGDWV